MPSRFGMHAACCMLHAAAVTGTGTAVCVVVAVSCGHYSGVLE